MKRTVAPTKASSKLGTRRLIKPLLRGWTTCGLISAPLWLLTAPGALAGPSGEIIVGGSGSINRSGNLTEIQQRSDRLAIDWQKFDVNANEVVRFIQPAARSIALNRILDSKQSLILGRIEANGKIFLVNPRGIIFGRDASVNVAGLVASSLDIDPQHFMQGNFAFADKGGDGVIVNQGTIEAAVGGAVVLLGKVVINDGDIHTPSGSTQLISAGGAVVSFDANNQLGVQITSAQQQKIIDQADAVRNSGTISAEGGYIALTGAVSADLFTNAVNNQGVITANSMHAHNGVIELSGGAGNIAQSGALNVSAIDASNAGSIRISGATIEQRGQLLANGDNGGTIQLQAQDILRSDATSSIAANGRDRGGVIELRGARIGILDNTRIAADGGSGGGTIHIGGRLHGAGGNTAQRTVVSSHTQISADALKRGNGGEVVLWSDAATYFTGAISTRGGAYGGDGGMVEVSSKQALNFAGDVDTHAPHGKIGELLLDPAIINIVNGSGGADDAQVSDNIINASDSPGQTFTISEQKLEGLTTSVTLAATQQINIANLADNYLLFNPNGGTVTFDIAANSGVASFTMADLNDTIRVNNGNLIIQATNSAGHASGNAGDINFTLGKLSTTGSGNITVSANTTYAKPNFSPNNNGGSVTITTGDITSAGNIAVGAAASCSSNTFGCNTGAVTVTTNGIVTAGGSVNYNANTACSVTTESCNSGAVTLSVATANSITAGGAVTLHGGSVGDEFAWLLGTGNGGAVNLDIGAINAGGAVTVDALSDAQRHGGFGNVASTIANVITRGIAVSNNSDIQITANSTHNAGAENITLAGNYFTAGSAGSGNIATNSNTLSLAANTTLDTTFGGSSGANINLIYAILNTAPYVLTYVLNDIYLGDIAGSATSSDLGFSQTMIDNFAGSNLILHAKNNIYVGNATITSTNAGSLQLFADNDNNGIGDFSIASGKTLNVNGKNLTISAANATINGTIINSGAASQQINAVHSIAFGSGATITSGSGNIALTAGNGIAMANNAAITSTTGQIALSATNNIALGSLTTGNTTAAAVAVNSTGGAISNAGAATNITANAAGSRTTLQAATGINANLSIDDLALSNSTSGTIAINNNRSLQVSAFTNTAGTATTIAANGAGSNLIFGGALQNGGGNATLTANQTITLQNISGVNTLTTSSTAVTFAQNTVAGAVTSSGTATVAGNLTATTGNLNLQTVALGAGAHTFSSNGSGDIILGAISGNSDLSLLAGRNATLAGATLGAGNFSASSASGGTFTASGNISANNVALKQFSTTNLARVMAANTLAITANTINLNANLSSGGAMTLTGATQLQNNLLLDTTNGGASSGGQLALVGSLDGNGHTLDLAAGNNVVCVACTPGLSAGNIAALNVLSSIKTVFGAVAVTGDATIRADQEIYLNDNISVGGNLALLADANSDGIGIAGLLTGKTLAVGGTTTTSPIALTALSTAAQCTLPTALPTMPTPPPPPVSPPPIIAPGLPVNGRASPTNVGAGAQAAAIAVQEAVAYTRATSQTQLHNTPQIAYLDNDCQRAGGAQKNRQQCEQDASMMDFLGTFLIDNQIPQY